MLAAGCSAKGSTVPQNSEPSTAPPSPETIVFDWQSVYEAELSSFKSSSGYVSGPSGSMFDIIDISGDAVPELIISPDISPDTKCHIYTYVNGSSAEIGTAGANGYFELLPSKKVIGCSYVGQAFELSEYYSIEEISLVTKDSFYNNRNSVSSGAVMKYQHNNEDVRIADYEKALAEYTSQPAICVGRRYSFSDEAVKYALRCSESWSGVMNKKQKEAAVKVLNELSKTDDADSAFDIIDIDRDNIPEIIWSEGAFDTALCHIYKFGEKNVASEDDSDDIVTTTVLNETGSLESKKGSVYTDITNKNVYTPDSDGSAAITAEGKPAEGNTPSENIVSAGRRYLLSAENIKRFLS